MQEFWNNQLAAVDTLYAGVKKSPDPLKARISNIDVSNIQYISEIETLLGRFRSEYESLYGAETRRTTTSILAALNTRAIVPFVSRQRFSEIALTRKRTKTPPGFKDDGDGDFFVWADLLLGLSEAKNIGLKFSKVVLVTHDRKIDWVRDGIAHPILAAELFSLFGTAFEIWTISRLIDAVGNAQTS